MSDRQIHASVHTLEIVRYDRGGKWYAEIVGRKHGRRLLTIAEAAMLALECEAAGGEIVFGLPGGRLFDKHVNELRAGGTG